MEQGLDLFKSLLGLQSLLGHVFILTTFLTPHIGEWKEGFHRQAPDNLSSSTFSFLFFLNQLGYVGDDIYYKWGIFEDGGS